MAMAAPLQGYTNAPAGLYQRPSRAIPTPLPARLQQKSSPRQGSQGSRASVGRSPGAAGARAHQPEPCSTELNQKWTTLSQILAHLSEKRTFIMGFFTLLG